VYRLTKSLIGSEKSADQAWDFLSSWFVIGGFYRGVVQRWEGCSLRVAGVLTCLNI
jgi:hypothetical protein